MPVRSLNSSVLKWPRREEVEKALLSWAEEEKKKNPDILHIGVFGSFNTPLWGVGSDLDIVVVLRKSLHPFWERPRYFDTTSLPVPADLLVYTEEEFEKLEGRFAQVMRKEVRWICNRVYGGSN